MSSTNLLHTSPLSLSLSQAQTMKPLTVLLLTILLTTIISPPSFATRFSGTAETTQSKAKGRGDDGFFGPGGGFNIPGFGTGWGNGGGGGGGGYGAGFGGPGGGYSKGGTFRSSFVCQDKGPCYKKKLICPAKCFYSYSRSGKNYGSGGGGGGCAMDCRKSCTASCI